MITERNELRTANAGYEQALENMLLEKNKSKGAMSTNINILTTDLMDEIEELYLAIKFETKERVSQEAGDCIVYLSRMIEVIKHG
jgi:DNA phosphorothioation-dependent restriction protein DptG